MMRSRIKLSFWFWLASALVVGCGSSGTSAPSGGDDGGAEDGKPGKTVVSDGAAPTSEAAAPDAGSEPDPTQSGPFAITELDATTRVAATGDDVPIHCAYPTAAAGPFPVIVFAHGFQIPSSEYYGYVRRLASFGYVALTADYPAGFTATNNVRDAKNLSGALDWAASASQLAGRASVKNSGAMGHSRGGKAAVLAATGDPRFVAIVGLDPVDSKPPLACDPVTECPDSRDALAAHPIPSLLLGETTDSTAGSFGQACAPKDGNYMTFTAKASSPSVEVTFVGANHMSFVEDVAACGFTCSVCKPATADHARVLDVARAMSVAFFERHIRGNAGYQTYLDGAQAKALWVGPGLVTIKTK